MSSSESGLAWIILVFMEICFIYTLVLGISEQGFIGSKCSGFGFLGVTLTTIGVLALLFSCSIIVATTVDKSNSHGGEASVCCCIPVILVILALGIFALSVSSKGGGKSILGISYKEYHVESYSKWMQNKVRDTHNWENNYKKVIVKEHVCSKFAKDYKGDSLDQFHKRNLSPFESGCCKPPEDCNFNYISSTNWVKPDIGNYSNVDCNRWDNDPSTLCFNCQSCKAALLQDVTGHWFFTGIALIVIVGLQVLFGIFCIVIACTNGSSGGYSILA